MAGDRNQPLLVEIVDGELVIRIGIDTLIFAARTGDDWDERFVIVDADVFAEDIRHELEREQEDGTTPVHMLIDAAVEQAIDQGSLGIDEAGRGEEIVYDRDGPR